MTKKYQVTAILGASAFAEVEADSPEDAIDKADVYGVSLCHQCSNDVDLSDPYEFIVRDAETGETVIDDGKAKMDADARMFENYKSLREALAELVALKDLKDAVGKTAEYEERQPKAWAAARDVLARTDRTR